MFVKFLAMVYNCFMAIEICVLGSGSKGNCVLLDNGKNRVIIDAGLSARSIKQKLMQLNLSFAQIDGILITHEHTDHIRALDVLSREIPVYAHDYTMEAIAAKRDITLKNQMNFNCTQFSIGTLDIQTFCVSHDAVYPLGYTISDCQSKVAYATDMGYCSRDFMSAAEGAEIIMIESNHDVDMLMSGDYPAFLKRRIVSNKGHLSNLACAMAINELAAKGTKKFILAHLSENNNLPELAYWTNVDYLKRKGAVMGQDINLYVADQRQMSSKIGSV